MLRNVLGCVGCSFQIPLLPGIGLQGAQQEPPGPCCPQGPSPKVVAPILALVAMAVQSQEICGTLSQV